MSKNTIKTTLLLSALGAFFVLLGGAFFGGGGATIGLVIAFLFVGGSYWFSDKLAVAAARGKEVSEQDAPELHAMVSGLAQQAGMPMPRLYLSPMEQPNAFATGRNPRHAAVCVTQGILQVLEPDELRGVLAHELGHVRNRDILISSVAAAIATAIMFLGLGIAAERGWARFHFQGASPGALQIEVVGQQFQWNFRYPGPDGVFGRTDPSLINDAGGNFVGLDTTDPAAQDDLVLPIIAIPVNREVELILRAKDVTHSFFVRELRFKQDTVPGLTIRVHFTANKVGKYEIACAELCGLGHHRMRSDLFVLPPDEYENWLRQQAETE